MVGWFLYLDTQTYCKLWLSEIFLGGDVGGGGDVHFFVIHGASSVLSHSSVKEKRERGNKKCALC